jgi:hypothetical protein
MDTPVGGTNRMEMDKSLPYSDLRETIERES